MEIKDLHRQGVSQRRIARITGHSRNTISRALCQRTPEAFERPARHSVLDPYKVYLTERYDAYGLSSVRLLSEIQAQGYPGSLNLVQRFVKTLKDERVGSAKKTVRFETAPGEQAQADWAEVGALADGPKVYAFLMVLGFSRMLFVGFTQSMALPELLRCHEDAFAYFGGAPGSVLYDNMAQVRLPGSGELNPLMADFAGHFGFAVKTHRVRRPRTKGKVERMVDYLKDNFLNGRSFAGMEDLACQGRAWLESANRRLHATTGERPVDLLPREKLTLLTEVAPYRLAERHERKVDAEGFVHFCRSRYSVPPQYVGKRILLVQSERRVQIRRGDLVIAEHGLATTDGSCVADKAHVEAMWRESLARGPRSVPPPKADFTSAEAVATRSLTLYEEVSQ